MAVHVQLEGREARIAEVILRAASGHRRFGRRKLALILAGSNAKDLPPGHPAFGALKELPQAEIGSWLQTLLDEGYLGQVGDEYPVVAISPKGSEVLRMGDGVTIARAPVEIRAEQTRPITDEPLLARLRTWRRDRAQQLGKPAYVVFTDKTLHALAETRPATREQLLAVHGIGSTKLEAYGQELLAVIAAPN